MPIRSPGDIVLKTDAIDIRTGRSSVFCFPADSLDDFPAIPVLWETLLLMELRSREFSVDLGEMSSLALCDVGATLQILRLAARESLAPEHSVRMEDCISGLGMQACLSVMGEQAVLTGIGHSEVPEIWAHAREVAQACRAVAAADDGVHPEEAWLVGLLHGIGSLPRVLGWQGTDSGLSAAKRAAVLLAERWSLPPCVQEFCRAWDDDERDNRWIRVLRAAHPHAGRSPQSCPLASIAAPRLRRVL